MTFLAVAVEPVKAILSTPERHKAFPVSPSPVTSCSTGCSGTISAKVRTSHAPIAGVSSEGLKTTALPAASAYAIEPIGVNAGKFHGPMTPMTPRGRYSSEAVLLAVSRVVRIRRRRSTRSALRADQSRWSMTASSSSCASSTGLPFSRWIKAASSSSRRAITPFQASSRCLRSPGPMSSHQRAATRARSTASATDASSSTLNVTMSSSVAGSRVVRSMCMRSPRVLRAVCDTPGCSSRGRVTPHG